ncbi:MAG TPA: hypothetical protein DCG49_03010 [Ruminococcus sp.]|nr:hypothetical protein [Ruminococcus sp.]
MDGASGSSDVAEQTGSGTGTGETMQTAATTQTTADPTGTLQNIPMILTDAPEPSGTSIAAGSTDTNGDHSAPPYVLPAGYQEIPMQRSALNAGTLVLVNKDHASHLSKDELDLEQVYYATDKPETYEISYPGHTSLNRTALTQFNRLMKAYYGATSNSEIMFNYGYLEAGKEKSNPESPTALDVQLHVKRNDGGYEYVTNTTPYSWLFEHMSSYGYILRYPTDKAEITGERGGYTAIRYVGVPHAAYMREKNLCLEEYLEMMKTEHNFYTGTVLEYSTTELTYHIYYVPAKEQGDELIVPVPTSASYEVSGNNVDGFIVTVIVG